MKKERASARRALCFGAPSLPDYTLASSPSCRSISWRGTEIGAGPIGSGIVRINVFLIQHKGEYGYKADGVKLGDADKIIFWYKPKDAAKYRALFGDLHAADVDAGQLPKQPK